MRWQTAILLALLIFQRQAVFAQQPQTEEESAATSTAAVDGQPGMNDQRPVRRVDMQGPAFLSGDHVYKAGQWVGGYKYSSVYLNGNLAGTTRLADQQSLDFHGPVPPHTPAVDTFMMVPTHGTTEMHFASMMRGVTDNVTVYLVPTWMVGSMSMLRRDGATVTSSNSGFGDLPFGVLWRSHKSDDDEVIFNLGLSAPTGDIDGTYQGPGGTAMRYPYPMRFGHGTWDLRPAATYRYFFERASVGVQGMAALPVGRNHLGYRVGDEYRVNTWFDYLLDADKNLAATFRVEGVWRGNYVGQDSQLNPLGMPGNDPNMRGGDFLNFGYGVSYILPGRLGRLDFEVANPIAQNVRGVQLGSDWAFATRYLKRF